MSFRVIISLISLRGGAEMLGAKRGLRMTRHGLRTVGDWETEPFVALFDACRASLAIEKLLGESLVRAHDAGHSWQDIGRAVGVSESAQSWGDVARGLAASRRHVWDRYMGETT
jgi:hypothetical protein